MDATIIIAVMGLAGPIIGGAISFRSTKSVRRLEWKQDIATENIRTRESLYAEFLAEVNRLLLLTIREEQSAEPMSTKAITEEVSGIITLEGKIWLHSEALGEIARSMAREMLSKLEKMSRRKAGDNGVHEKQEVNRDKENEEDGKRFSNLRDKFIHACRDDLTNMRKGV